LGNGSGFGIYDPEAKIWLDKLVKALIPLFREMKRWRESYLHPKAAIRYAAESASTKWGLNLV
jgi:hypothetical protein